MLPDSLTSRAKRGYRAARDSEPASVTGRGSRVGGCRPRTSEARPEDERIAHRGSVWQGRASAGGNPSRISFSRETELSLALGASALADMTDMARA